MTPSMRMASLAITAACTLAFPASRAWAQDYAVDTGVALVAEKGAAGARLLPALGLGASLGLGDGASLTLAAEAGSLLGTTGSLWLGASYALELGGAWRPEAGVVLGIDLGDAVFYGGAGAAAPPDAQAYAGFALRPLAFAQGALSWSALDLRLALGLSADLPLRFELSLFSLSYRPGAAGGPATSGATSSMSVGLSYGLAAGVASNYLMMELDPAALRLEFRAGPLELGVEAQYMGALAGYPFEGVRVAAELLLAPAAGAWDPAVGLGYYVSALLPRENWRDPDQDGPYFALAPLRWRIPLGASDLMLSCFELRAGPIVPTSIGTLYESGSFMAIITALRCGLRFPI